MINENMECGIELLDRERPGWQTEVNVRNEYVINVEKLNMKHSLNCILAQLWGGYGTGKDSLGIDFGEEYGFNDYTEEWKEYLTEYRASGDSETEEDPINYTEFVTESTKIYREILNRAQASTSREVRQALLDLAMFVDSSF